MSNNYLHVVLTGGPCGGKSSSLPKIQKELEGMGYRVHVVHEAARIVYSTLNRNSMEEYQIEILRHQLGSRNEIPENVDIVFYDRAELDGEAYTSREWMEEELIKNGYTREEVLNTYDIIFHFQTKDNYVQDEIRRETKEEAIALDSVFHEIWSDHDTHYYLAGSKKEKREKVVNIIESTLKMREPVFITSNEIVENSFRRQMAISV